MNTLNKILKEELSLEYEKEKANDNKIRITALTYKRTIGVIILSIIGIINNHITLGVYLQLAIAVILFMKFITPERELMKIAKKHPDTSFSTIVKNHTSSSYSITERILIGVSIALVGLFLCLLARNLVFSQTTYSRYNSGYRLDNHYQAFFDGTNEYIIPETHKGLPVVAIGERAFLGNTTLEKISVPDTVSEIGSRAFKDCSSLERIWLGSNVTAMGGECFMNCSSLAAVVIPKKVTEIRGNTFENCENLVSVMLHDNIKTIHGYAFRNCTSLTAITLPAKITEIRGYLFEGCSGLKGIVIPDGVTRIAAHAFYGCSSLSYVEIPDSVRSIGSSAFRKCDSLLSVTVPNSAFVDERAFKDSPTTVKRAPYTVGLSSTLEDILKDYTAYDITEIPSSTAGLPDNTTLIDIPKIEIVDGEMVFVFDDNETADNSASGDTNG